jgi:hypothetical protein
MLLELLEKSLLKVFEHALPACQRERLVSAMVSV